MDLWGLTEGWTQEPHTGRESPRRNPNPLNGVRTQVRSQLGEKRIRVRIDVPVLVELSVGPSHPAPGRDGGRRDPHQNPLPTLVGPRPKG